MADEVSFFFIRGVVVDNNDDYDVDVVVDDEVVNGD